MEGVEPLINREARPGLMGAAMLCTVRPHPSIFLLRDWSVRLMAPHGGRLDHVITEKGITGRSPLFINP